MNELNPIDLSIACIVCIGYISGKLWMYYNHTERSSEDTTRSSLRTKDTKNPKSKGVIKRGKEWD